MPCSVFFPSFCPRIAKLNSFFLPPFPNSRYIRSERSVILINFCLSIICSNALILVGQTQARNKVRHFSKQSYPLFLQFTA